MPLYVKILIGLIAGTAVGLAANLGELAWLKEILLYIEPVGAAFIKLLKMIVIPLVVASLVVGAASLGDLAKLGRIGIKTFIYYTATTALAAILGLTLANLAKPGRNIDPAAREQLSADFAADAAGKMEVAAQSKSVRDLLLGMIPENPVASAANFDLLPLIFFSLIFGVAFSLLPAETRTPVLAFFDGINQASMTVIGWIMLMAPYAVFALLASIVANFGLDLLATLVSYAVLVAVGLLLHLFATTSIMVTLAARLNPLWFFRQIISVPIFAFSTSSSSATLPVTISTARRKLGISREISGFVLPLGATMNMDGTAIMQAIAALFIGNLFQIPLDFTQQLTILVTATLASIGTAAVPSAGIVMLIVVLETLGIEAAIIQAGIALVFAIDRPLDMLRTSINVTGDLACAAFVARSEGEKLGPEAAARAEREADSAEAPA